MSSPISHKEYSSPFELPNLTPRFPDDFVAKLFRADLDQLISQIVHEYIDGTRRRSRAQLR